MLSIRRYFWAGICALLMSVSLVQAETTKKMIPTPALQQYQPPTTSQPAPPTAMETVPSSSSQPAPPTEFQNTSHGRALPDLYVSEYSLDPSPPSREAVVDVRIGVYNQGGAASGPFTVQWWPGDNYSKPGCTWRVEGLVPNSGRILKCSGYVYSSWYGRINTGVYIDSDREVQESNTRNNKMYRETQVTK